MDSLPEDVIIYSILPKILDARALAQCALVSKDLYRFTSRVQSLHFDFPAWCNSIRQPEAEQIVSAVISRSPHLGSLAIRYSPQCPSLVCLSESTLESWIRYLSSTIRELKLSNKGCAFSDLVTCLSRCSKLESLSLEFGYFDGIPQEASLRFLRKCFFSNIIFHRDDIESFCLCCPVLEKLTLEDCYSTQNPVITLNSNSVVELEITDSRFNRMMIRMSNLRRLSVSASLAKSVCLEEHSLSEVRIIGNGGRAVTVAVPRGNFDLSKLDYHSRSGNATTISPRFVPRNM